MIRGGRSLVSAQPAFSNDAKKLLVCTANTVSIFSTSTGLQMAELEGHTAPVTSVIVEPASSKVICFCWTASLDGTIRYWDFAVPELMRTITVGSPISSMVIPRLLHQQVENSEKPAELFAYIAAQEIKQKEGQPNSLSWQIKKCNLTRSRLSGGVILAENPNAEQLTISPSGDFIGIYNKRKLYIWGIPLKDSDRVVYKKIKLHHTKTLTAIAFHPTERTVAAGDATGRILLWRGVGRNLVNQGSVREAEERPGVRENDDADSCTTWHWHSAEVKVLFFSSDGAYLYSGGREGVLVVWQLDTGKKKFLPRIGSPLLYFRNSADPSLSSISCADNCIHLLRMPSMEILQSISGIKLPRYVPESSNGSRGSVYFGYALGVVAVCTENYCIQFYSLFDDREISEVQVCERNHQPGDEITMVVNLVALSPDGSIMSTVETRLPEEGIGSLVSLKFWSCDSQSKNCSLSTVIYEPHRDAGVSSIAFHPTRYMAATSSYGADFKIWVRSDESQRGQMHISGWTCHAVGSYKKKMMTAATFSADGSILAVAAETMITLWDPERNVLVAVIGESFQPIRMLSFVGKSEYLVSASGGSNPQLSIWRMSKLSLCWSYKLDVEAVACTGDESIFAVLALLPKSNKFVESSQAISESLDGVILLFNPENPSPLSTWFVKKAEGGALGFISQSARSEEDINDGEHSQLLLAYMNNNHEYVMFDPYGERAIKRCFNYQENFTEPEDTGRFGYASIYGELPEFKVNRNQIKQVSTLPSGKLWESIFSGSSHTLPPLTKLCSEFLESLLEKRSTMVE